jgi:Aspartate/tyrosine/aromatic aminotransferase
MRKLANLVSELKPSPIREMLKIVAELKRNKIDVIQLSTGQPSLPVDKEVLDELIKVFLNDPIKVSSYTPTGGIRELHEAIVADLKIFGKIDVNLNEVVVTEGATEGLLLTALALFEKGDEVVMMDPSYVSYPHVTLIAGAKPIYVCEKVEEGYQPNLERIKEKITEKTKAIILATPDNPTGRVIREEIAKGLIDLSIDHDFWLIIDEAYKHLIYEGEHYWFWRYANARERTICVNTFSKDPAMTGFRLGYIYGPSEVISAIEKIKQYTTLCSNTPAQIAAIKYLQPEVKKRILEYTLRIYKARRDALYNAVKEKLPEVKTIKPEGAMYMFVNMENVLRKLNMDDYQFMIELVKNKHVAVIYGGAFGPESKNHIRLTFVGENEERLRKGVELIREFIDERK